MYKLKELTSSLSKNRWKGQYFQSVFATKRLNAQTEFYEVGSSKILKVGKWWYTRLESLNYLLLMVVFPFCPSRQPIFLWPRCYPCRLFDKRLNCNQIEMLNAPQCIFKIRLPNRVPESWGANHILNNCARGAALFRNKWNKSMGVKHCPMGFPAWSSFNYSLGYHSF